MSDYEYPSGDELQEAEEQIEDLLSDPAIQQLIEMRGRKLSISMGAMDGQVEEPRLPETFLPGKFDLSYGRKNYKPTEEEFTYDTPYKLGDFERMIVCRTSEYNFDTNRQDIIEANPNDPSHVLNAMRDSDDKRVTGLLEKRFCMAKTTTGISMTFAAKAIDDFYRKKGLNPNIISNPSSGRVDHVKGNYNKREGRSYAFATENPEFHRRFQENVLLQMNHRITQEAIEKNRTFFPDGSELTRKQKSGFTFGDFVTIANEAAADAFARTRHQMKLAENLEKANKTVESYRQQFNRAMKPKLADENMVEAFGKQFKARKHETKGQAVNRIRKEYRQFAHKKFDELQGKGIEVILAQGIARSRGLSTVTMVELKEAHSIFAAARKDPVTFRSPERIIKQVTGKDKELTSALLHNLDGRSTFQRSYKTVERFGAHLSANADGRTRLRKTDREEGKAFAAGSLMGVPPSNLAHAMSATMKDRGYSAKEAVEARGRMLRSVGKIKVEGGKEATRDDLRPNVITAAGKAAKELPGGKSGVKEQVYILPDKQDLPPGLDQERGNDNDGPAPDGSGKGRGRRR